MNDLDARLIAAHSAEDQKALVELYQEAAHQAKGDKTRKSFYLTHAYVFALEQNHPDQRKLKAQLQAMDAL